MRRKESNKCWCNSFPVKERSTNDGDKLLGLIYNLGSESVAVTIDNLRHFKRI